jgi:iron complex transport system ATP-binding protein
VCALLSAGNLRFAYGQRGPHVINDVSLALATHDMSLAPATRDRAEVVGILGPNGSGKSTLLRLLSGALAPLSGTVTFEGHDLRTMPRRALAQQVAVVPQETTLAFDYTVIEVVLMGRYPHLGTFEVEGPADVAIAMQALEATGTAAFADRQFSTLSGGEKQRVVIASALAQLGDAGRLLVLDEPTASLDLKYQFEVAALVRRIHAERGIAILLSTHDLRFAAATCTRLVLLQSGRILADGPPAQVLTPALVGDLFDVPPQLVAPILAAASGQPAQPGPPHQP